MKRLISMAAGLAILLAAADVVADPRSPAIAALPGAAPVLGRIAPASTGELEGLTRAEALRRLQLEGFKAVSRLVRDSEGNWIGAARRGDRVVDVAVDQDGDVITW